MYYPLSKAPNCYDPSESFHLQLSSGELPRDLFMKWRRHDRDIYFVFLFDLRWVSLVSIKFQIESIARICICAQTDLRSGWPGNLFCFSTWLTRGHCMIICRSKLRGGIKAPHSGLDRDTTKKRATRKQTNLLLHPKNTSKKRSESNVSMKTPDTKAKLLNNIRWVDRNYIYFIYILLYFLFPVSPSICPRRRDPAPATAVIVWNSPYSLCWPTCPDCPPQIPYNLYSNKLYNYNPNFIYIDRS